MIAKTSSRFSNRMTGNILACCPILFLCLLGIGNGMAQPAGEYEIANAQSGKAISVDNAQTADGTKIQQWDYTKAPEQIWSFSDAGSGYIFIVSKPSGKVIDVYGGLTADGTRLHLWSIASVESQKWKLDSLGNNEYYLTNKYSGKVASIDNTNTTNGDTLTIQTKNGGVNQKWKLTKVSDVATILQGSINSYIQLNAAHTEPLIPKWALGYWQSQWGDESWGYANQSPFMDHAKSLRGILPNKYGNHKHPADVMVLDMYWCDLNWNWPGNMNWSYTRFPNPQQMIDSLHKMNFKIALNYHADGFGSDWLAKMKEHLTWGVDVVWCDFWNPGSSYETQVWNLLGQQWGTDKRKFFMGRHFARPNKFNLESGTPYGVLGFDKVPNEDAIEKTMPVHWTGDVDGSWNGFKETIEGIVYGIDGAMDGWSYLHSDCPGHSGGTDPALANRWIQFADFSPVTRNHGFNPRDVWSWGAKNEANSYFSRMLRYRLLPYIYTCCWQIYENAMPLTRPFKLAFPGQRDDIRYSYMFGDEFLVAPVFDSALCVSKGKMDVFLPAGQQWVQYWTHDILDGGQTVKFDLSATDDKYVPLYVKRGAIIPMGPEIFSIDTNVHPDPLTLDIYPLESGDSKFTMYDDDGATNNYKNGARAFTTFGCKKQTSDSLIITIGADSGNYAGKPASRNYILKINLQTSPTVSVKNNGAAVSKISIADLKSSPTKNGWAYDDSAKITYIQFSASTSSSNSVVLKTGPTGAALRNISPVNICTVKTLLNRRILVQYAHKNTIVNIRNLQGKLIDTKTIAHGTEIFGPYAPGCLIVELKIGNQIRQYKTLLF